MTWHNLRIRTRILLGFATLLVFTTALTGFLIWRISSLNTRISQLNATVVTDTQAASQLAGQVALTEQAIDRYFLLPQPLLRHRAATELQTLRTMVTQTLPTLMSPQHHQRLVEMASQIEAYHQRFNRLSDMLERRESERLDMSTRLLQSSLLLADSMSSYLQTPAPDADITRQLVEAQAGIHLCSMWISQLVGAQDELSGGQVLGQLDKTSAILQHIPQLPDPVMRQAIANTLDNLTSVKDSAESYMASLAQIRAERNKLFGEDSTTIKQHTAAIAGETLQTLTGTTADLERQALLSQQLAIGTLALTLLVMLWIGTRLARAIAQPLQDMVRAIKHLEAGDAEVVINRKEGGEIGDLTQSFNHMAATLHQQRLHLLDQQRSLTARNQDLEQALQELQAANAARAELTNTVRTLSVPVLPVMERVIVVPLVGEMNTERAQTLLERLLDGIVAHNARVAILDITGVPIVDTVFAEWLIKLETSARLMGVRCILAGISPEVAQGLVSSGRDLVTLSIRANLRSAVMYAQQFVSA